jgi:non-specific serine/threonine protein kinase
MSVIDELYENRDATELSFALDEKFERLREFKHIPEITAPVNLQPILRPYQLAGYQWLNYLNDVGWGGILADDMGLGKTVQALTMLQHYQTQEGKLTAIVVCPTTLIYNWENEIRKFTPEAYLAYPSRMHAFAGCGRFAKGKYYYYNLWHFAKRYIRCS